VGFTHAGQSNGKLAPDATCEGCAVSDVLQAP
jgi:hypothetical protein